MIGLFDWLDNTRSIGHRLQSLLFCAVAFIAVGFAIGYIFNIT